MLGSPNSNRRASAAAMLAAGLLAACCLLTSTATAQPRNQLPWAPTRDEAVIIDGIPGAMQSPDTSLSRSLLSQRPKSLSRPAPTRARTYFTDAQTPTEALPSVSGAPLSPEGLPVPPEMYYDDGQPGDGFVQGNGYYGDACCPKRCGNWCGDGCRWIPLCLFIPLPSLSCFEVFGGVQGFTGPANRGGSGSFGFHEGFNWGVPLAGFVSGQLGVNWTQSNFSGSFFTPDSRNQIFLTTGLFRRVDWGFQGGLVFDYLHDEWDYSADLAQLRGELSWLCPGASSCGSNEIGFWFTAGVNNSNNLIVRQPVFASDGSVRVVSTNATLAVNELYAFFFRRHFANGGQGRLFGGFTGNSQGLVGGDAQMPINPNWSLRSNFIFVTSGNGNATTDPGFARESWNVGISLVWTPCPRGLGGANYNRPLFNVADNGSFLTRLIP
jgi:hypothetical protein